MARFTKPGVAVSALLAMGAALGGPAAATVVYQTGFEAPAFTAGVLAGQNGWSIFGQSAAITVQSGVAASGTQAVQIDGSKVTSQTGPYFSSPTAFAQVSMSADILLTSASAPRAWQFSAIGAGLAGFSGGIDIDANGTIRAITNGFANIGSFSRDVFHNVDIRLDYTTQTYSVLLDGATLASNLAFCGDNGACLGAVVPGYEIGLFDTFGAGGNDFGYLDNFLVQTIPAAVPEPAGWALMIAGLGLAGASLRRRRMTVAFA